MILLQPEQCPPSAVLAKMLSRLAIVLLVVLASCAPTPPPAAPLPAALTAAAPPMPSPSVVETNAEVKPALTVEAFVVDNVVRWKITNQTSEPWQLDLEHAQQYWARDCRSPLKRIDNNGHARCMPIHIETNVAAYAKLDPSASALLTLSIQYDSRGPEPVLPAGRYQLTITTTNLKDRSHGPTAQTNFRVEGLKEEEAQSLAQRVAFATEHGCTKTSELGQRALAWTAPAAIALSALNTPGVPWMRARYARLLTVLPEAQEQLRSALHGSTWNTAVAVGALLSPRTQPLTEVREEALRALPSVLSVSGFDPILVQAVADSDYRTRVLEAVAWRVSSREEAELGAWEGGLSCARVHPGDELPLADLIHAFRTRALKAKPDLAVALRARANALETQLRERKDVVDQALRIARAGRPPFNGPNALAIGRGCGYSAGSIRPDPVCTGTEIPPDDPAVRFLKEPMTLHIE